MTKQAIIGGSLPSGRSAATKKTADAAAASVTAQTPRRGLRSDSPRRRTRSEEPPSIAAATTFSPLAGPEDQDGDRHRRADGQTGDREASP